MTFFPLFSQINLSKQYPSYFPRTSKARSEVHTFTGISGSFLSSLRCTNTNPNRYLYVLLRILKFWSPCVSNETQNSQSSLTNQTSWQNVDSSEKARKLLRTRALQRNAWGKHVTLFYTVTVDLQAHGPSSVTARHFTPFTWFLPKGQKPCLPNHKPTTSSF